MPVAAAADDALLLLVVVDAAGVVAVVVECTPVCEAAATDREGSRDRRQRQQRCVSAFVHAGCFGMWGSE